MIRRRSRLRIPDGSGIEAGWRTHHVVDVLEDVGEAADDQGELVLGDVDQTFLVVLRAHLGVRVLVSHFDGKLRGREGSIRLSALRSSWRDPEGPRFRREVTPELAAL